MRAPLAGAIAAAGLLALTVPAFADDPDAAPCITPSCEFAVAATRDGQLLVVDAEDGGVHRHLVHHTPPTNADRGAPIDAISLSPSRTEVYYSAQDWDDGGRDIYRIGIEGGEPELVVEDALAPAVSPDGRFLAYSFSPDHHSGSTTIAIRTLATGEERHFGPGGEPEQKWGAVGDITWAPDATRIAFTYDYEGVELRLLDLLSGTADWSGARNLGPYRSPSWNGDGLFATEWCCFPGHAEVRGEVVRFDPATGEFSLRSTDGGMILDEPEVYGVDVRDGYGSDLLVVRQNSVEGGFAGTSGALDRIDTDGSVRRLGAGYAVAAW
ncbi:MAG: TolB family protein [Acidimicrobiia bacterium]